MILDIVRKVSDLANTRLGRMVTASAPKYNQHLVSAGRKHSLDFVIIDVPKPISKRLGIPPQVGFLLEK